MKGLLDRRLHFIAVLGVFRDTNFMCVHFIAVLGTFRDFAVQIHQ